MNLTIGEALQEGKQLLKIELGEDRKSVLFLEAEVLLAEALELQYRERWILQQEKKSSHVSIKKFFNFLERRSFHEPIAYILQKKEFFSLDFYVNSHVLIPRKETELITDYILEQDLRGKNLLDLGTGSGALIQSVAYNIKHLNKSMFYSSDISKYALKVNSKNKKIHNGKYILFKSNLLDSFRILDLKFNFIISNPPYIATGENIPREIQKFEPHQALYGGEDGLSFYRILAKQITSSLLPDGEVVLEIADGKCKKVIKIFKKDYLFLKKILYDFSGIQRAVVFKKKKYTKDHEKE